MDLYPSLFNVHTIDLCHVISIAVLSPTIKCICANSLSLISFFLDIIVESHMLLCLVQSPLPEHVGVCSKPQKDPVKSSAVIVDSDVS